MAQAKSQTVGNDGTFAFQRRTGTFSNLIDKHWMPSMAQRFKLTLAAPRDPQRPPLMLDDPLPLNSSSSKLHRYSVYRHSKAEINS